ncbi:MAG: methyltransferase domain-containing protein [Prevotellaceae bacterium]|jgi:2-polyprenyl-3-methyl-5-hydroxy-6-metoxy-1,4-benzoquinol methylase|nr:methyltransferase domain-containing protein [Prevotellaceae bacterium]
MDYYNNDSLKAIEAVRQANWIAFAPVIFQASRALKNLGILDLIEKEKGKGLSLSDIATGTQLSEYGVRVLCEAGLAIGLLYRDDEKFFLTKTAYFFMHNDFTVANTDFVNDVCYNGMFRLEESVRTGKPEGLKTFGEWNTVYEGLSQLPENVRTSWFAFDHYYSDVAFDQCLKHVFEIQPKKILDIGGNTGKFACKCLQHNQEVHVAIADLPGQLEMAKQNAAEKNLLQRITFVETNLLDERNSLPKGYDAIWLSQFLDCFSENEIVSILNRCVKAMNEDTSVFILEPFWDRQRFETSAFCLIMTSLYFTAIANGNSRMYTSDVFYELIDKAGLSVEKSIDDTGVGHTLLQCRKKNGECIC